jgi:hypothetical protein
MRPPNTGIGFAAFSFIGLRFAADLRPGFGCGTPVVLPIRGGGADIVPAMASAPLRQWSPDHEQTSISLPYHFRIRWKPKMLTHHVLDLVFIIGLPLFVL